VRKVAQIHVSTALQVLEAVVKTLSTCQCRTLPTCQHDAPSGAATALRSWAHFTAQVASTRTAEGWMLKQHIKQTALCRTSSRLKYTEGLLRNATALHCTSSSCTSIASLRTCLTQAETHIPDIDCIAAQHALRALRCCADGQPIASARKLTWMMLLMVLLEYQYWFKSPFSAVLHTQAEVVKPSRLRHVLDTADSCACKSSSTHRSRNIASSSTHHKL
jgi:hypothetical protein